MHFLRYTSIIVNTLCKGDKLMMMIMMIMMMIIIIF